MGLFKLTVLAFSGFFEQVNESSGFVDEGEIVNHLNDCYCYGASDEVGCSSQSK